MKLYATYSLSHDEHAHFWEPTVVISFAMMVTLSSLAHQNDNLRWHQWLLYNISVTVKSFILPMFQATSSNTLLRVFLDSKVHGANMGPIWVLLAPDGRHVGPMNFVIWVCALTTIKRHREPFYVMSSVCDAHKYKNSTGWYLTVTCHEWPKPPTTRLFIQEFVPTNHKENIKFTETPYKETSVQAFPWHDFIMFCLDLWATTVVRTTNKLSTYVSLITAS